MTPFIRPFPKRCMAAGLSYQVPLNLRPRPLIHRHPPTRKTRRKLTKRIKQTKRRQPKNRTGNRERGSEKESAYVFILFVIIRILSLQVPKPFSVRLRNLKTCVSVVRRTSESGARIRGLHPLLSALDSIQYAIFCVQPGLCTALFVCTCACNFS